MREQFALARAPLAAVYYCPYHPTEGLGRYKADHPWRKPRPGMILQAAADYEIDLPSSALIGDSDNDIKAGASAGIGTLVLFQPKGMLAQTRYGACHIVGNLAAVAPILKRADMHRPG
jgi:D-glycero-D-manno-heptose 1,7-bisphosphate phosphatase